jgi:hypothetical protein
MLVNTITRCGPLACICAHTCLIHISHLQKRKSKGQNRRTAAHMGHDQDTTLHTCRHCSLLDACGCAFNSTSKLAKCDGCPLAATDMYSGTIHWVQIICRTLFTAYKRPSCSTEKQTVPQGFVKACLSVLLKAVTPELRSAASSVRLEKGGLGTRRLLKTLLKNPYKTHLLRPSHFRRHTSRCTSAKPAHTLWVFTSAP